MPQNEAIKPCSSRRYSAGYKGSVLHLKNFVRILLDDVRDGVPVRGSHQDRLQNQHVESALQKVPSLFRVASAWHAFTSTLYHMTI